MNILQNIGTAIYIGKTNNYLTQTRIYYVTLIHHSTCKISAICDGKIIRITKELFDPKNNNEDKYFKWISPDDFFQNFKILINSAQNTNPKPYITS